MEIKALLEDVVKRKASDVFIVAGSPCAIKIDGKIEPYDDKRLMPQDTEQMIRDIYTIAKRMILKILYIMAMMTFLFPYLKLDVFVSMLIVNAIPLQPSYVSLVFITRS